MAKDTRPNEYKVEIVGGVIAGIVLLFITGISESFRDWLFKEMGTRYSNPLWRILLFILIAFITGILIVTWRSRKKSSVLDIYEHLNRKPEWTAYHMDSFETNVVYKWEYIQIGGKWAATDFERYCPKHNSVLLNSHCPIDNEWFGPSQLSEEKLQALIRHRVENGHWKDIVAKYKK